MPPLPLISYLLCSSHALCVSVLPVLFLLFFLLHFFSYPSSSYLHPHLPLLAFCKYLHIDAAVDGSPEGWTSPSCFTCVAVFFHAFKSVFFVHIMFSPFFFLAPFLSPLSFISQLSYLFLFFSHLPPFVLMLLIFVLFPSLTIFHHHILFLFFSLYTFLPHALHSLLPFFPLPSFLS